MLIYNDGLQFFNENEIFSIINQAGHCSQNVNIYRGYRQGDPISSYIIILCVEILARRIRNNEQIKGVTLNYHNIVMSQFADDTSIKVKYLLNHV